MEDDDDLDEEGEEDEYGDEGEFQEDSYNEEYGDENHHMQMP